MSQEKFKRYFQFFLVILAAGSIYPLVYLKSNYQETILQVFNMSNAQLNTMYTILGWVFVFGYIPSGILSDRFSAKKLLAISLFFTGLGGLWFAQVPNYEYVMVIFGIWGIFSVFTFWSAHMKIVKLLATENEQGTFFGILDGGRGVVEALLASLALFIFSGILGDSLNIVDKRAALIAVIYMYSAVLIITSVMIWFFVQDDKKVLALDANKKEAVKSPAFKFSELGSLFKNKKVYLLGGIIFMGYAVFWTVYYLSWFLETYVGIDPVSVAGTMVVVLWMRPVGGFIGGFLADKIGRTTVQIGALTGAAACLVAISVLPVAGNEGLFPTLIIVLGIFLYAIRGTYWSLLGDLKLDAIILGTAIGAVSFIGYMPDIILPEFNTFLWKTFGDMGGFNAYFISSAILGMIGVVLVIVFGIMVKKENKAVK
ncbi:MAG: major facilitator superfamily protein [Erysipelotrichaceae bacterium]|nr:MAG: major facilitator superfamily [Erysipelotrichaceae bacterium]TXT19895.1 MAG: major facilitator superfamily protein [Erysipelotrichaceae bacterium]